MKLSILYHSETKNTEQVAQIIAEGARVSDAMDIRLMPIDAVDFTFLQDSKAVFFGSPTYCGSFSWQLKKWLDTNHGKLAGKLGAVFITENHLGGGADFAELSLIGHLLVHGMVVYSGGASLGHPFTHFGAVCIRDGDQGQRERASVFGQRIAQKALELFSE